MGRKDGKPRGRMSSYVFFVQCFREEHKKKNPTEKVVFAEFSKKCAEKWRVRFLIALFYGKFTIREEMQNYGARTERRLERRDKDPNAPKRSLSAFFFFCNEERPKVRKDHGDWSVALVAKEMGKRWEKQTDRSKYEKQAAADKIRYEQAMAKYRGGGGGSPAKKPAGPPAKKAKPESEEEDDDDEEEEEDDEEDDE
ncbi:High mobility group protein DSP1,High mobility group protein 1 homolog,High mobility group protein B1,High mobility group protein B2 [Mytilus edulis]|uniref:High mobility group protein DSP1,High mobility group protein 1 homolog,High mobility group protein B1,High mobility group protein B2 n=1 Tax=Mytilus edulis TaxID=6550 RepID=A0A8S3QK96_MYTED|nr:High mobility group protein DSP1,High mobility group protein 1 homolog,High mobility group protein B1,High mobility group protein B2 [Mytilus edulis]